MRATLLLTLVLSLSACSTIAPGGTDGGAVSAENVAQDPTSAQVSDVDRFSANAGTFFRRDNDASLPAANAPINLDQAPFKLSMLAPDGSRVSMYDLDARTVTPANLYIFVKPDGSPLTGQLYVFDALPGEPGYNDFCAIQQVTVPANYVPNSITSRTDLEGRMNEGFKVESTGRILDMPVVPKGSSAQGGKTGPALLLTGWCRHQVLYYFAFDTLQATSQGLVPTAPMYAFFASSGQSQQAGFRTADTSGTTRNVLGVAPGATGYSPLWALQRLADNDFINVSALADVQNKLSTPAVDYGAAINAVAIE